MEAEDLHSSTTTALETVAHFPKQANAALPESTTMKDILLQSLIQTWMMGSFWILLQKGNVCIALLQ